MKTRCKINKNFLNKQIIMENCTYQILIKGIASNRLYLTETKDYDTYRSLLSLYKQDNQFIVLTNICY